MSDRLTGGFDLDVTRQQLQKIDIHGTNFDIIWLADEISCTENNAQYMDITNALQVHLGSQNIQQQIWEYGNVEQCINRLHASNNRSIILFVCRTEPLDAGDLLKMCNLPQVEYMYELGSENPRKKSKGKIMNNVDQSLQAESDFHIIPPNIHETSIQNVDDETKKQFIKQLLLEVLQKLPYTAREKDIFVDFILRTYDQSSASIQLVHQEIDQLSQKSAIWFYTGDHTHRILSKTLREGDPVPMINMHYFIKRLYDELKKLFTSQFSNRMKSTVKIYRGKAISIQEFNRLKGNVHKLVLTNSFVSTSRSKEIALKYCGEGQSLPEGKVRVLFVMEIAAYDNPSKPIAFLEEDARANFENELLLTPGIIFRVHDVKNAGERWEIFLVRDVAEVKYEEKLYLNFWSQIYSMFPVLNIENLPEDLSPEQLAEYCKQIMQLLQATNPEIASQLQMHPFSSTVSANRKFQTKVGPSTNSQTMNSFGRSNSWSCRLPSRSCFTITIIVVFMVVAVIVLSSTIPTVGIGGSFQFSVAKLGRSLSEPNTSRPLR